MAFLYNFDATTIDPTDRFNDRFKVIPAGSYQVIITESDEKQDRNGNSYIRFTLEIQSGEYQGRKLFHNLNLHSSNSTAQQIAQRHLSQICHAVGVMQPDDTQELEFKPLIAVVKISPPRNGYDESNDVSRYESLGPAGHSPAAPSPPRQSPPSAAPWVTGFSK